MLLTRQDIEKIHEASLQILEKTGVKFSQERSIEVFKNAGVRVEDNIVYIDPKTLERCIESAPSQIHIKARNKDNDICLGTGTTYCGPVSGVVNVRDHINGRRRSTGQDYLNFLKLSHTSEMMQLVGGIMVTPNDIDNEAQVAFMMTSLLTHTDKALWGLTIDGKSSKECIDMARLVFGDEKTPFIIGVANAITPLIYDDKMLDSILTYVDEGQPICISCCGTSGFTAPVTLAGTLAVNNAEILAGVVLTQLVSPGAPVIYGNVSTAVDMKTMGISSGSPETSLIAQGAGQLAEYYNIPSRVGGTFSNAIECDVQSGYETMMLMLSSYKAKADILILSAGELDSFMTASYEKFIIDEEIRNMVLRYLRGIEVNDKTLAIDDIHSMGPGGNFMSTMHTFEHFRSELFNPQISNRVSYESWEKDKKTRLEVAYEACQKRLEEYKIPDVCKENSRVIEYWKNKFGELPSALDILKV
ncbi:trimethylamine methyltransferase family protein [Wukongibacter baidiensis]|uniref:trimethylamine methyltransferase family protein n=1 Tax=Wukongibacter baidiensis TaxID=1723361 RepID=UPI003D7F3E35